MGRAGDTRPACFMSTTYSVRIRMVPAESAFLRVATGNARGNFGAYCLLGFAALPDEGWPRMACTIRFL